MGLGDATSRISPCPRAGRAEAGFFYPAVENLLLAARAHGLAACLTSWHLFAEDEFKAVIGIPKEVQTWAIIPIGWPLRRFGPVNRRPVDEVIHRERW
jgi:nitroreductase